jgi:hypothetical protein
MGLHSSVLLPLWFVAGIFSDTSYAYSDSQGIEKIPAVALKGQWSGLLHFHRLSQQRSPRQRFNEVRQQPGELYRLNQGSR